MTHSRPQMWREVVSATNTREWRRRALSLQQTLVEIADMPFSPVNDSESLRHTIKTIQQMARTAIDKEAS